MTTPLIKFCGNRSFEDYKLSVHSQATYIGFIFFGGSKRYVQPNEVNKWVKHLSPKPRQSLVGVFVNPSLKEISDVLENVNLDVIQLHGQENPGFVKLVKTNFSKEVWKAIHHTDGSLEFMQTYNGISDGYVVDVKADDQWGGTGRSFEWKQVPNYLLEADRQRVPCLIAGGIRPDNIETLLRYRPLGIDVASGIESDEKKSKALMDELERKVVMNIGK